MYSYPFVESWRRLKWNAGAAVAFRGKTSPHYFDFGQDKGVIGDNLLRPDAWDALRTRTSGPFMLPSSRADWEKVLDTQPDIEERSRAICRWLDNEGAHSVASYGVGGASLEGWMNRLHPELRLVIGEYAPATVEKLRHVFPEAEVHQQDLLLDDPFETDHHLLHRVDTDFTNEQWKEILARFAREKVLVVVSTILDWSQVMTENAVRDRGGTFCGTLRNRRAFEALWRPTHRATQMQFHDLQAWSLEPRS